MKLSEAIREGAKRHPQIFGDLYNRVDGAVVGSCALGAAMLMQRSFPLLQSSRVTCPACMDPRIHTRLDNIITHLNDNHRWTREAIADWVATLEPAVIFEEIELETTPEAITVPELEGELVGV